MIHAYDKSYLSAAQKNLARMLDYLVNDLHYPLETACFVFRSPLNIFNAALIEELLNKKCHLILAFDFTFSFSFVFHFIKHIAHIAWASSTVFIFCVPCSAS